jgi:hypothetical protein
VNPDTVNPPAQVPTGRQHCREKESRLEQATHDDACLRIDRLDS